MELLTNINHQADEMMELLVQPMKKAEGVTKVRNQMKWVSSMNFIHVRTLKIILNNKYIA